MVINENANDTFVNSFINDNIDSKLVNLTVSVEAQGDEKFKGLTSNGDDSNDLD